MCAVELQEHVQSRNREEAVHFVDNAIPLTCTMTFAEADLDSGHTVHQKPLPTIFGAIRNIGCPGLNAAPSASRPTLPLGKAATLIMPVLYCDLVPQSSIICP